MRKDKKPPANIEPVAETKAAKTKLEVVQGIQRFRPLFQGILDLTDFIAEIDQLERTASEAQSRKAQIDATEAVATAAILAKTDEINQAEQRLRDIRRKVEEAVAAVKGEPARIIAEAKAEAVQIRTTAQADAAATAQKAAQELEAAKRRAEHIVDSAHSDAAEVVSHANQEAAKIGAAKEVAAQGLRALEQAADEKAAELDGLNKKIDDAKAAIAKLLA